MGFPFREFHRDGLAGRLRSPALARPVSRLSGVDNVPLSLPDNRVLTLPLNLPAVVSKPDLRGRLLAVRSDAAAELLATARTQIEASRSQSTRDAYQSDWNLFTNWCASVGVEALPASIETVSAYLVALGEAGYADATIERHTASISVAHKSAGYDGHDVPTASEAVRRLRSGQRGFNTKPQRAAAPLAGTVLDRVLDACDSTTLRGKRDHALILVAYVGAFRRSELVALQVEHLRPTSKGLTVHVPRSKSDQEGRGDTKWLPYGTRPEHCPISALNVWLEAANITSGHVWRPVDKWDHLQGPLNRGEAVNLIVKRLATTARLPNPDRYTGHSLRAGFVTVAAEAGATDREIARQTGHAPGSRVLHRYISHATPDTENAAGKVI